MIVQKAFKYRFFPTDAQAAQLAGTFGCARFVYNQALEYRSKSWQQEKKSIGYHDTALIRRELEQAGFSDVAIETLAEQSRASSPAIPAMAYCQGTLLRNEIEARAPGKLDAITDQVAAVIADKHGHSEVAAKIQAHIIMAAA